MKNASSIAWFTIGTALSVGIWQGSIFAGVLDRGARMTFNIYVRGLLWASNSDIATLRQRAGELSRDAMDDEDMPEEKYRNRLLNAQEIDTCFPDGLDVEVVARG